MHVKQSISVFFLLFVVGANAQGVGDKYYGNISLETSRYSDRGANEKIYGTNIELFSKENSFGYKFGLLRSEGLNASGDIFYINPSYKLGSNSIGALLRNDEAVGFVDKAVTFGVNTESDFKNSEIVPYAYGYIGTRDFKNKGDAANYLIRLGLRKELYSFEVERKHTGSVGDYQSVSSTTLNPKVEFLVGNSKEFISEINYQYINTTGNSDFKKINLAEFSIKWLVDARDVIKFTFFERNVVNDLKQKSNDSGIHVKYAKYF